MMRAAPLCSVFLGLLARALAEGDTVDVLVTTYRDPNCFEKVDEFTNLDEGCYATLWTNLTRAYQLKIVVYDPGSQKVDLREYIDDCWPVNLFRPARTMQVGKCEPFIGGFYAILGLRWRSPTCVGLSCSQISVAMQRFYSEENCAGVGVMTNYYPVQGECMRWSNGTQTFTLDPEGRNISQVQYMMNHECGGSDVMGYWMMTGTCYSLYSDTSPKSFRWQVELGKNYASVVSGARRSSIAGGFITSAVVASTVAWKVVAAILSER